ncbi:MAG: lauroyl acyltransferase [Alphaproteobacteria bacterium]|nr:lauroyl acyltransferase [Alphaproteobacteria bacterium]
MADLAIPKKKRRRLPLPRELTHRLEALGAAAMFRLFRLLPLDAASGLGGWLGRTVGPRLGITKRAQINLRRALPHLGEAEARAIMRAMWDNLGRVIAEYPHLADIRVYAPGGRVAILGEEHVEALLASGKPMIFISAHFGNWEIPTMAATQRGLAVAEIYRAANNPWVDKLIHRYRGKTGSELIPKGMVAAKRLIGALRQGQHLGILVDQKMNDGIPIPFFGRDAMTAPAVAQLALRFGCAIVPARVERLEGARFRIVLSPPLAVQRSGDREADTIAIMTAINREIESWVRARPEMWLWLHRRWPD